MSHHPVSMAPPGFFARLTARPEPLILLLLGMVLWAWWSGQSFWITLATRTAILALAALSLSFILGQGGLVSFGHAAPLGVGAYAVLIATEYGITDVLIVFPLAFACAAVFSALTGAIALRTKGVYFIMITLAFAQMVYFVFSSLSAFGGDDGMSLAARSTFLGQRFIKSDLALALFSIALLLVCSLVLQRICGSRFGRVFRACKENESRMAALGFRAFPYRLIAYCIAGGVAGLAGALLANQSEFIAPSYMNWHRSGELIVMVVLGSAIRLPGALYGAAIVVLLEEALSHSTEYWKLWLGLIIVLIVLMRGVDLNRLWRRMRHG